MIKADTNERFLEIAFFALDGRVDHKVEKLDKTLRVREGLTPPNAVQCSQ